MEQTDFLEDIAVSYSPADKGMRFFNYIIDIVVFYVFCFLVGMGLALIAPDFLVNENDSSLFTFLFFVLFIFYYGVMEGATNGKTVGKFITKTRALKEDGTPLTYSDSFKRALIRIIPFEPLSALGSTPWHDRWSRTMVVKESKNS